MAVPIQFTERVKIIPICICCHGDQRGHLHPEVTISHGELVKETIHSMPASEAHMSTSCFLARTPPLTRHWVLIKSQKWGAFLSAPGLPSPSSDRIILFPRVTNTPWQSAHSLSVVVVWLFDTVQEGGVASLALHVRQFYLLRMFWKEGFGKVLQGHVMLVQVVRHRDREL